MSPLGAKVLSLGIDLQPHAGSVVIKASASGVVGSFSFSAMKGSQLSGMLWVQAILYFSEMSILGVRKLCNGPGP